MFEDIFNIPRGLFILSSAMTKPEIDNMVDKMKRRGPDDRGVFHIDGGALGHRRLTIIDLVGGQQPMISRISNDVLFLESL